MNIEQILDMVILQLQQYKDNPNMPIKTINFNNRQDGLELDIKLQ